MRALICCCCAVGAADLRSKLDTSVRHRELLLQQYRDLRDHVNQQLAARAALTDTSVNTTAAAAATAVHSTPNVPLHKPSIPARTVEPSRINGSTVTVRAMDNSSTVVEVDILPSASAPAALAQTPAIAATSGATARQKLDFDADATRSSEAPESGASPAELRKLKETIHAKAEDIRQRYDRCCLDDVQMRERQ